MATKRARSETGARSPRTTHKLKITLRGVTPKIWRRVLVPSEVNLGDLNLILQAAMGWTNSHLHLFVIGGTQYSDPEFELDDAEDEFAVTLAEVAPAERRRFSLLYDFGDGWDHDVLVEKVLPREADQRLPCCLAGERSGPPEDCGGPFGYRDLLDIIRNPKHEEHNVMLEWVGESFDPEAFDLAELNGLLLDQFKSLAKRR